MDGSPALGKRERQIMDIIYRRGRASAAEVLSDLPDPPTYTAVRGMLRHLEDKGLLRHEQEGPRYIYSATSSDREVRASAVAHFVRTFFNGSASAAVAALLSNEKLPRAEYERLSKLLDETFEGEEEAS